MNTARILRLSCWLIAFFATTHGTLAQAPAGYYNAAQGKTGTELKTALYNIIKGHTSYPYTSSGTDTWDILKIADRDPNNPDNVVGIYSGFSMNGAAEYNSGNGWTREHVWAKSRGDFGTTNGAGTDLHHLRAEDNSTNTARNNRNFDEADEPYTDASGTYSGPTESLTSSTEWIWEPPTSVKGDIARMLFYMTTRYEGENGEPDLELQEAYLDNLSKEPFHSKLSTLIAWHLSDPVSDAERQRNDVIYSYQGNRNPYIDNPDWVCEIWATECGGTAPTNNAPVFTSTPATTATEGTAYTYNVSTTDSNGDAMTITATTKPSWLSFTANGGNATLSGTPTASHIGSHNVALNVTDGTLSTQQTFTITVSPAGTGGNGTEVLISEYVEGSSYNKGIEIANITAATVDLSAYSLKKQTNGTGSWSAPLALSGNLASGNVYVVVHSSANTTMQSVADMSTGNSVMSFNGDDAVGLFKNDVLIDIVGVFNSTAVFGANVTLVRNADVSAPNSTYTTSEWSQFGTDYLSDLGSHTFNGGGNPTPVCNAPTSLSSSVTETTAFLSWQGNGNNYNVRYRVAGTTSWATVSTGSASVSLSGLASGTTFEWEVMADCGSGSTSDWVASGFTTSTVVVSYCSSYGQSTQDEWIASIRFNGITYNSGNNGGYGDFTSTLLSVSANSSYNLTIYPAWSNRTYREAYDVWVDWNADGDFNDAGEYVQSWGRTTASSVSGTIAVPSYAKNGKTRMRIAMKYNRNATACEVYSYGEVEDYTLNISGGGARMESEPSTTIVQGEVVSAAAKLWPNPAVAGDKLTIELPEAPLAEGSIKIIDLGGRIILNQPIGINERSEVEVPTVSLKAGVYIISLQVDGYKFTQRVIIK